MLHELQGTVYVCSRIRPSVLLIIFRETDNILSAQVGGRNVCPHTLELPQDIFAMQV